MENALFIVLGLMQLGIAMYGTVQIRKQFNWYFALVLAVTFGLAYDNFAIASGGFLGQGELLKNINAPRYWVHAFLTPAMMIACFGALRLSGSKFAQGKTWHIIICVLATAMIGLGAYIDVFNLTLVPEVDGNVLRYVNDFHPLKGPPIPSVTTILVVLVFGIILWRNRKFPWLFAASLFMFIAAGAGASLLALQNVGEVAFAAGLVATQVFANKIS